MAHKIERDFTAHGLRCVVLAVNLGHRCGYVGVPKGHKLYGLDCSDRSPLLKAAWDSVKEGPIGKRSILPVILSAADELPRADVVFDVHGSLTYSDGDAKYPVESDGLWWFGFDCEHSGDLKDESIMDENYIALERKYSFARVGVVRTEEYVAAECERLAEQLAAFSQPLC